MEFLTLDLQKGMQNHTEWINNLVENRVKISKKPVNYDIRADSDEDDGNGENIKDIFK